MKRLPPSFNLPQHSEVYESFGETRGGVHDLKPVLAQMSDAASEYLTSADADFEASGECPFPPSFVWQYFVDPDKRLRWQSPYQTAVEKQPNALGRTGLGSTSHCAHADGKEITRHYLDWRPFRYMTVRFAAPEHKPGDPFAIPSCTETIEFSPNDAGGTILTARVRVNDRSDETLDYYRTVLLPMQRAGLPIELARLLDVLQEDAAALGLDESGDPEDDV